MRIKKVVAQGFKTYAKSTEFIFDPGVTAIVGPNGSGKSNVSDAIRWCLGEQSFSLLRSKKTSDVIFSGSDRKSRLGLAQVTVTLENENGELPVDFTEVEITRRAYRDGNNEYLLNGQRIRLQDITEILATTGLGKRTYALIGQGLIERLISMAPDDLRTLFEEAAGITTHQAKRSAALRRLDAARLNLTRVNDITAEISPRLGYLRRQAERTEQRNEIADNLRGLLEEWYGFQWHAAQKKLRVTSVQADELQQRVANSLEKLESLTDTIERKRAEQATLRSKLGELHTVGSEHHRDAERIGRDLAVSRERHRQLTSRIEQSQQELAPLGVERETLVERIAESEQALDGLDAGVCDSEQEVVNLQSVISQKQQLRRALEEELAGKRSIVEAARTQITRATSHLQQMESRTSELEQEHTSIEADVTSTDERRITLQTKIETKQQEAQTYNQKLSSAADTLAKTEAEIDELRSRLDDARQEREKADRALDQLQTRYELLSRLSREGAGYASGVQAVLQAANRQQLTGIRGTVASALRVPEHLDKAIETALGGAYQNIITDTWSDAQDAIKHLSTSRAGRATFLPLNRLSVLPAVPAPTMPGILGNAAELVDYELDVANVAQQLLNRVWIAENLEAARQALDALGRGPRPTVVTVTGEIVRPGGAVTGGEDSRRRHESILARERELRELPDQVQRAERAAIQRGSGYDQILDQLKNAQQSLLPLQDEIQNMRKLESYALMELSEYEKTMDRLVQAKEWHTARINQIRAELAQLEKQLATSQAEMEYLQQELIIAQKALEETEQNARSDNINELMQQLAEQRALAAKAQGDLQSRQTILSGQRNNLTSVEAQIEDRRNQIARFAEEIEGLGSSIDSQKHEENRLTSLIAELQQKISPLEQTLAAMERAQSLREMDERRVSESLRLDESAWSIAQLASQRAQDAVDQLHRDIEMEFSLIYLDDDASETTADHSVSGEVPTGQGVAPILENSVEGATGGEDIAEINTGSQALDVDAIIAHLPVLEEIHEELDKKVSIMRRRLSRLKNVNPVAPRDYAEAAARCEFLEEQSVDLEKAVADLHEIVAKLDEMMEGELVTTFAAVSVQFVHFFEMLFEGGTAKLSLTDSDSITTSGIEIIARPPGKRPQTLALLSGGERTLTACALIFAILRVSPTPFCVLDEVDAALDEANVDRFRFALDELSRDTQFILITHNRRTLEGTNAIYGVTMGSDGVSRVISLKLEGERIVRSQKDETPRSSEGDDSVSEIEEIVEM